MIIGMTLEEKFEYLKQLLAQMQPIIVAYSGGVDSSLLFKVAHDLLSEKAMAVTAISPSLPRIELEEALIIAKSIGGKHVLIEGHELEDPSYSTNTPERCYFCKHNVYTQLNDYAEQHGYKTIVDGTNADDQNDHRPGRRAAMEHGVRSPLLEAGITKADIRELARRSGLRNWNKPSVACLSSRIPYGTAIEISKLDQIEKAEEILHQLGFSQVRVRHHVQIARIEVELGNLPAAIEKRAEITNGLRALGFSYVALDLEGFRSGSMNEVLEKDG